MLCGLDPAQLTFPHRLNAVQEGSWTDHAILWHTPPLSGPDPHHENVYWRNGQNLTGWVRAAVHQWHPHPGVVCPPAAHQASYPDHLCTLRAADHHCPGAGGKGKILHQPELASGVLTPTSNIDASYLRDVCPTRSPNPSPPILLQRHGGSPELPTGKPVQLKGGREEVAGDMTVQTQTVSQRLSFCTAHRGV